MKSLFICILKLKITHTTRTDVFYQHKDKYNNEIKEAARPAFPVEYLIIDLPSGSAADAQAGD